MKKYIIMCMVCFISTIILTGCNSNKLKKGDIDLSGTKTELVDSSIQKIEIMNIMNDANLYSEFVIELNENINTLKKNNNDSLNYEKIGVIYYDYLSNIYKLAASRVASDVDTIYINSNKYKSYIAMMQVYVDCFNKEKDKLYKYLINNDKRLADLKCGKMADEIEKYFIDMYIEK